MKTYLYPLLTLLLAAAVYAQPGLAQTRAQDRQQMDAELQAVNAKHQKRLQEITERYSRGMQAASTAEERGAVQQAYQADMYKLLQQTQEKVLAIQQSYRQQNPQTKPSSPSSQAPAAASGDDTVACIC